MSIQNAAIRGGRWSLVTLLVLAGCGPSRETQQKLAELTQVSAEKDSLLAEVSENARLMSDISAELARVQTKASVKPGEERAPVAVTRDSLLAGIKDITTRLQDSEKRLAAAEKRVSSLRGQTATLRKTIQDLRTTITNQKETIASLTDQVNSLQVENTRLVAENTTLTERTTALADTVSSLSTKENTVYYIVGTKDDLLKQGIVTEEGGSRVLFVFGKKGKVLVPARDLDRTAFTAIDKRQVTDIPLPDPSKDYHIASRQDLSALENPPQESKFKADALHIADPDRFWANNRFLIIVES